MHLSRERFEALASAIAEDLLKELPPHLRAEAASVLLNVEGEAEADSDEEPLLGLYEGVPLVERGPDDVRFEPDRITLYYKPLTEMCATEDELRREIRVTLVHEFGHFFGFDEDELEARGWG
jgi:predicted Zn-dependent protease with MMP-like domain